MRKLLFIFAIFASILILSPQVVRASSVFFSVPEGIEVGETFEVLINADTENQLINSIDLVIDYNETMLSFAGYQSDDTVVKFWIDSPKESEGRVYLSGIIPGGVSGLYDPNQKGVSPIPLVRLLFTAQVAGASDLSFVSAEILKHDGKGTALESEVASAQVLVVDSSAQGAVETKDSDTNPPQPFNITFLESSFFGRTPPLVVFETEDLESGIKEYQIKVGMASWQSAKSPTSISKSIFSRNVTVRAFDFNDNFRDATLYIPGLVSFKVLGLILLVLVVSGVLTRKLLKYKS